MSSFKPITIQGVTYDFAHLAPITLVVTIGVGDAQQQYSVLVNFSCHCFTEKLDATLHTPDLHFAHENETRAFCPIRHGRSLSLPQIINGIGNRKVHFTFQNNFMLVEMVADGGAVVTYTIFFEMKRGTKGIADVVMRVVSAYDKQDMPRNTSTIKFHTLVAKVARGERPTAPPPNRRRR